MTKAVTVSATDLVRHFGDYAKTALGEPVQIAQHGQIRLVLANADLIGNLATRSGDDHERLGVKLDILFDATATMVTLVDKNANITRMNAPARRYFQLGDDEIVGRQLHTLLGVPETRAIPAAIVRVVSSGRGEDFFIGSNRYPGRTLHARIVPFPGGAALFTDDVTDTIAVASNDATRAALECALDLVGVGEGAINLRGVIERVSQGLERLVGATSDRLLNTRLSSLFSVRHRDAVASLVESALSRGQSGAITCELFTEQGPLAVCLSIAPVAVLDPVARASFLVRPD